MAAALIHPSELAAESKGEVRVSGPMTVELTYDKAAVEPKLNDLLEEMRSLAFHEEILHRDDLKDQLLSMGERMSSLMFSSVLAEQGVKTMNFDVRKVLRTDSEFGEGAPQIEEIDSRLSHQKKRENSVFLKYDFLSQPYLHCLYCHIC